MSGLLALAGDLSRLLSNADDTSERCVLPFVTLRGLIAGRRWIAWDSRFW